ncbi:MAG TPA: hypothetical protein VGO65_03540 [Pseudolysinimonas sp.]|jgi:hypothetical protein|nr:hypothetical protein [Pseudolysinimonas sp.]
MRWDHLFDDLESQLEHELAAEEVDLFAEEERLRLGRLALRDRFRAMMPRAGEGSPLRVLLTDGSRLSLTVGAVGRDWIAGELANESPSAPSCIVPLSTIAACFPDADQASASMDADSAVGSAVGSLSSRLGLGFVLRDLCRRRAPLQITTAREQLHGTIDRVARDHFDLAEHDPGVARRDRAVRALRMLPMTEIVLIRF